MAKIYRVIQIKSNQTVLKCSHDHRFTDKAYLNAITVTNISRGFYRQDGVKISRHRYGTKLRHCHPVYKLVRIRAMQRIAAVRVTATSP